MSEYFIMYLLSLLLSRHEGLAILISLSMVIVAGWYFMYHTGKLPRPPRWVNVYAITVCIVLFLSNLIPDTKGLMYAAGAMGLYTVSQSEEVHKLPDNVLKATNRFLEEYAPKEMINE